MDVSASFQGSIVRIVDMDVNGSDIYITYVDTSSNLKTTKILMSRTSNITTVANNTTVN